jgi:hypothetical protein
VWTGPFVATTRPSAHAFRMHASHAARNLQHGRGMCRAQAWDGVSQAANSVCSPPPCGEGVGVGVAVILLGSSSSMPSTLESSTPRAHHVLPPLTWPCRRRARSRAAEDPYRSASCWRPAR